MARIGKNFFKNLSVFFFSQLNLNLSLGKSQGLRAGRLMGGYFLVPNPRPHRRRWQKNCGIL